MKQSERLFDAITDIRDDFITEAAAGVPKRKIPWGAYLRYGALAASFVLVIGLSTLNLRGCGSSGGAPQDAETGSGAGNYSDSEAGGAAEDFIFFSAFSNNTGSILPLSVTKTAANGVIATRWLTFDLTAEPQGTMAVTDQYTLTNTTDHELLLPLTYPIQLGKNDADAEPPVVTINTQPVENTWERQAHQLVSRIELTLPAQDSVDISFRYDKPGSSDAPGNETIADRYFGFSLEPWRTNLTFDYQTLNLFAPADLDIVEQNFGFDPEGSIYSVPLKPDTKLYDMTVLYPKS